MEKNYDVLRKKLLKDERLDREERETLAKLLSEEQISEMIKDERQKELYQMAVKNADLQAELKIEKAKNELDKKQKNSFWDKELSYFIVLVFTLVLASFMIRSCSLTTDTTKSAKSLPGKTNFVDSSKVNK